MRPSSLYSAVCSSVAAMSVCIIATTLSASEIQWSRDIDESLRQSAETGKPILMEFTAKWCAFCRKMEVTTFSDPKVAARVHKQFIPVQVDADEHKELVQQLQIKGLPAILVVGPDLEIIDRISGYQTPDALMARLDKLPQASSKPAPEPTMVAANEPAPKTRTAQQSARTPAGRASAAKTPAAKTPVVDNPFSDFDQTFADTLKNEDVSAAVADEVESADASDNPFAALEKPAVKDPDAVGNRRQISFEEESAPIRSASRSQEQAVPREKSASFGGLCLVSAVDERTLTEGSPAFQTTYRGKQVQFCSAEHKQKFLSNPEHYWPMLDGACAATLADSGETVPGEIRYASMFRKRVWLFASEARMKTFIASPAAVVERVLE